MIHAFIMRLCIWKPICIKEKKYRLLYYRRSCLHSQKIKSLKRIAIIGNMTFISIFSRRHALKIFYTLYLLHL